MLKFLIVIVLTIVIYGLIGGVTNIINFIDAPSLLFILFFVVVMLLFSGYFKDFLNAFRILNNNNLSKKEIKRSIEAVTQVIAITFFSGLLGSLNAAVILFSTIEYTDRIIPSMGVGLLTSHYAMLICILFYPIKSILKGKLMTDD